MHDVGGEVQQRAGAADFFGLIADLHAQLAFDDVVPLLVRVHVWLALAVTFGLGNEAYLDAFAFDDRARMALVRLALWQLGQIENKSAVAGFDRRVAHAVSSMFRASLARACAEPGAGWRHENPLS